MNGNMTTDSLSINDDLLKQLDPSRLNILFIRHGQAGFDTHPNPKYTGGALTKLGLSQAARVAKRLSTFPITHLYSSDMARSYQTAEAISQTNPKVPWDILAELREISGFHLPEQPLPTTEDQYQAIEQDLQSADQFLTLLSQQHHLGELIVVAAHGGINRVLISLLGGIHSRQSQIANPCHTAITAVSLDTNRHSSLHFVNYTRHLPASMISQYNLKSMPHGHGD